MAWRGLTLAAAGAVALGGCETTSVFHPPGRDIIVYGHCLGGVYDTPAPLPADPEAARSQAASEESRTLWRLTQDIGSGRAFTNDPAALAGADPTQAAGLRSLEDAPFHKFLGCYLGQVDPLDFETRLLRGHIALAMIATYTAGVVGDATASKKKGYAQTAIGLITAAELSLQAASWEQYSTALANAKVAADGGTAAPVAASAPATGYADRPMSLVDNVARIDKILSTATFADSVAIRNIYGLAMSFAGEAASKVSPSTIAQDAAGQALKALGAAIRSSSYDAARFAAARLTLDGLAVTPQPSGTAKAAVDDLITTNWAPRETAWTAWNSVISDACTSLSFPAGTTPAPTCLPTNDQITGKSHWAAATAPKS